MNHKIAEQLRLQEQQAKVHADCATGTPAAPARALHTDVHYFVYRFRMHPPHWAAKDGWTAGVAGPHNLKAEPMPGGRHTFSRFEAYDSCSPEEHVERVRQLTVKK